MSLGPQDVNRQDILGARVLTLRDGTYPLVRFTVALRHGALGEPKAMQGVLAMLLPLMLRGTTQRSRQAFNAALEALGSSIDTVVTQELAYFTGTALTEQLEPTLALLGEALSQPRLDAAALKLLCEETAQALVSERDDDDAVAELFLRRALYGTHPMATPATGTVASLSRLTIESVRQRFGALSRQDCLLSFVGDIDAEKSAALSAALLERLGDAGPRTPALPAVDWPQRPVVWLVDKPERTQVQIRVGLEGVAPKHADLDAFWLGILAFGGTFTSPLTKEVRDVRGWSYFASADFRRRSLLTSPVVLRSAPALSDAVDCLALKLDLLAGLADGKLEQECLALARNYLLGRVPFQTATAFDLAGPALMLELLDLPAEHLWDLPDRLARLDLAAVPDILSRHLRKKNPSCVLVGPADALAEPLRQRFDHMEVKVVPYNEGLKADVRGDGSP